MPDRIRPVVDLKAICACGAVGVSVQGRVASMLQCSCLDCQQATGSGHSSVAIFDRDSVAIAGAVTSFDRLADSGATFTRRFCPVCGTPIFGTSSRAPDAIMLPVGLFGADSDWFIPNQLIFARSHHDWDVVDSSLPQHDKYRAGRSTP